MFTRNESLPKRMLVMAILTLGVAANSVFIQATRGQCNQGCDSTQCFEGSRVGTFSTIRREHVYINGSPLVAMLSIRRLGPCHTITRSTMDEEAVNREVPEELLLAEIQYPVPLGFQTGAGSSVSKVEGK